MEDIKRKLVLQGHFNGESLGKIMRRMFNMTLDDFSRAVFGQKPGEVTSSREAYIRGKFDIFRKNPAKLICYLDTAHLNRLAKYLTQEGL